MAYEDFTTWNEEDPGDELTVTTNTASITTASSGEQSYIDKSVSFTGDFWIQYIFNYDTLTATMDAFIEAPFLTLDNDVSLASFIYDPYYSGENFRIVLYYSNYLIEESHSDESIDLDPATDYYISFKRIGKVYTLEIRTGSHTGTLVDTLGFETTALDEFNAMAAIVCSPYSTGDTFHVSNLDLAVTAPSVNVKINIGDAWKDSTMKINVGDVWKTTAQKINISDSWKTVTS